MVMSMNESIKSARSGQRGAAIFAGVLLMAFLGLQILMALDTEIRTAMVNSSRIQRENWLNDNKAFLKSWFETMSSDQKLEGLRVRVELGGNSWFQGILYKRDPSGMVASGSLYTENPGALKIDRGTLSIVFGKMD
ncbi:MAG: hypothetical protein CVV64_10850 [Candidatus Wallbacteria bacterium HGW-Wallbacteria-1]|jgi:hypothetical protein|uniref:Uncharacterized protein n=1 Tax=Candidatus Wallbacteria bacterium HGW-Wallbacteria-1 TaxID=2013854 RepID=A0A2N1PPE9_9BACT|nr:MAG: hypothetical protein CVV64_10850 [Candidatus Wallbacteria bacterium HGW-Wallbacteria-1]